ncbi:MAG: DUF1189 family protein [Patescibacteria group bacterium]|jgi:hypothetical protein
MRFFAWLRHWINTAVAAATRTDFYRRLDERKPGEAVAHLALLSVFLWTLPFVIVFFVDASRATKSLMEGLRVHVPAGTIFEMKKGAFSNTLSEPLVFGDKEFKVIVNNASSTLALQEGESGLIVSASGVLQRDPLREQKMSFASAPDFRWTRENMLESIARWTPLALFLGAILMSIAVFGAIWIGFLLSVALHGFVLWLALKIGKRTWPWKRALVASAYAATGPIALNALLSAAGLNLSVISNIWYWLILIWIAYDAITRSAPAPGKGGGDAQAEKAVDRSSGGQ